MKSFTSTQVQCRIKANLRTIHLTYSQQFSIKEQFSYKTNLTLNSFLITLMIPSSGKLTGEMETKQVSDIQHSYLTIVNHNDHNRINY